MDLFFLIPKVRLYLELGVISRILNLDRLTVPGGINLRGILSHGSN